jgi:putative SOS response-associated peptidase YedK
MASCTIITAPANEFMEQTHSRMPIVLDDVRALEWLQPKPLEARDALDILMPSADAREWEMYAVSARVGNVRNDDAFFVAPL